MKIPFDFYHFTTNANIDDTVDCIFCLFIRDNETYFTPPDPYKIYTEIEDIAKEEKLDVKISVLGASFNKGLLPVTKNVPIIYIRSNGIKGIYFESYLINKLQMDLIYTTRLHMIKEIRDIYFSKVMLLDFSLRRAPSIQAGNRFTEIATALGYYTSNTNVSNYGFLKGTLPHAFVQHEIFSTTQYNIISQSYNAIEELIQKEYQLWKHMIIERNVNIILPDTINYEKVLTLLFNDKEVKSKILKNKLAIRIDTTKKKETIDKIEDIAKSTGLSENVYYILSGDIDIKTLQMLKDSISLKTRRKIIGIAVGTQVANNIKPLSIVYKLVQVNGEKVVKFSPGKEQKGGTFIVKYDDLNEIPKLIPGYKEIDHGIYWLF